MNRGGAVAAIRCRCPLCNGKTYVSVVEYTMDHRNAAVWESEVELIIDVPHEPRHSSTGTFTADATEDEPAVLLHVYPQDGKAEVSYRHHRRETWGPPTVLEIQDVSA